MANILIGMTIVAVPAFVFGFWQYRKYVETIRYVSDRWKGLHDELSARYGDLTDRWMAGIQPTNGERMAYETMRMNLELNRAVYSNHNEPLLVNGLAQIISSQPKS